MSRRISFILLLVMIGCVLAYKNFRPAPSIVTAPKVEGDEVSRDTEPDEPPVQPVPPDPTPKPTPTTVEPVRQPSPTQKKISLQEIIQSIREDIYCNDDGTFKLSEDLFSNPKERKSQLLRALSETSHYVKQDFDNLSALLGHSREGALSTLMYCTHPECLFIKGLILTNQLPGLKGASVNPALDMKTGLSYLSGLKFRYRANGIYPYFMLWPMRELGQKVTLRQVFQDFLRAPDFENPLTQVYVGLARAGELTPTAHLYADELAADLAMPDYSKATKVIEELIADSRYSSQAGAWAQNRASQFDWIVAKNLSAPIVNTTEISQLKDLARMFWQKAGIPESPPQLFGPEGFKEFLELRNHVEFYGAQIREDAGAPSHCRAMWEIKREVHGRYVQALDEMIRRWRER